MIRPIRSLNKVSGGSIQVGDRGHRIGAEKIRQRITIIFVVLTEDKEDRVDRYSKTIRAS
jgi:hypothetical protein